MRSTAMALLLAGLPLRAAELKSIIVADHETKRVIHIKPDGTLIWDAPNNNGHDVQLLPNGNLLINHPPAVREIDRDKKIVWEVGPPLIRSAESCQRLANGHTVIADVGRMAVVELDRDKKVVWEFAVPNDNKRPRPTMRQVRRLDNGNTLICASTEDKVIEVSPEKKVIWSYALPFPYLATRLPSGNTLISSGEGYGSPKGFFVVEVDPAGKAVWKYGGDGAPAEEQMTWPSGFVRLKNGNTLISIAHGKPGTIREVTPDKKTARVISSPALKHPCTLVAIEE